MHREIGGAECGKSKLCNSCSEKKDTGEPMKAFCFDEKAVGDSDETYLYELKASLMTPSELEYFKCIQSVLPEGYILQAQANLASFINRTDGAHFRNELYRNVDFLITDLSYKPRLVLEINDRTHLTSARRERDEKVKHICEEAGIPIIRLWTSYGVNREYIQKRIAEELSSLPVKRIHHFTETKSVKGGTVVRPAEQREEKKKGCYIATCVYGSYDSPKVRILREYRDTMLAVHWWGRAFIKMYYTISPVLVKYFGERKFFLSFWRKRLNSIVLKLQKNGMDGDSCTDLD